MKELFLFLLILICFFSKDGFNENIDKLFYFKIIIICAVYCILNNIDKKESLEVKRNNSSITNDIAKVNQETATETGTETGTEIETVTATDTAIDTAIDTATEIETVTATDTDDLLIKPIYKSGEYSRLNRTEADIGLPNEGINYKKRCEDQNLQFDENMCYYKGDPYIINSDDLSYDNQINNTNEIITNNSKDMIRDTSKNMSTDNKYNVIEDNVHEDKVDEDNNKVSFFKFIYIFIIYYIIPLAILIIGFITAKRHIIIQKYFKIKSENNTLNININIKKEFGVNNNFINIVESIYNNFQINAEQGEEEAIDEDVVEGIDEDTEEDVNEGVKEDTEEEVNEGVKEDTGDEVNEGVKEDTENIKQ